MHGSGHSRLQSGWMSVRSLFTWWWRRVLARGYDMVAIALAWLVANGLYFSSSPFSNAYFLKTGALVLVLQSLSCEYFGLYRGLWRFASMPDLVRILKAMVAGMLLSVACWFFLNRQEGIPRSVWVMYASLLLIFQCGARFFYRWFKDYRYVESMGRRVMLLGAGVAGEQLVRELQRLRHLYTVVGVVDDDLNKVGRELHGVLVFGPISKLAQWVSSYEIDLVLIAIPSATGVEMRRFVEYCREAEVEYQTLPSLSAIANGHVRVDALRHVSIEDLLGRDPVRLDWEGIRAAVESRVILVTGAGGSIGGQLSRELAEMAPSLLCLLDHSEYQLYEISRQIKASYPHLAVEPILGNIGDAVLLKQWFSTHEVQWVFHAAAYKHVPLLESQLPVAVKNNVFGTQTLLEAAIAGGVSRFVFISSDKAVSPCNAMGQTKALAERYCQWRNVQVPMEIMVVRFGNVLGSSGSVVPLFSEQISKGGPVTITHPEATRYFMTIPEACQLILQAGINGQGGEIFVLDMGEPVSIVQLAKDMIRFAGLKPDEDIALVYTGLRAGEKIHESLYSDEEILAPTIHPKIFQLRNRLPDLAIDQALMNMKKDYEQGNWVGLTQEFLSCFPVKEIEHEHS